MDIEKRLNKIDRDILEIQIVAGINAGLTVIMFAKIFFGWF